MTRQRGPGWWGEIRRHRDAAFRGWIGRSSPRDIVERERARDERSRSPRAINMDRRIQARTVYHPSDPEEVLRWKKDKARSDLAGVDTVLRRLTQIKKKTVQKVEASKVRAREIVSKAKERVREVAEKPKLPREVKERAVKGIVAKAKERLVEVHRETEAAIQEAKAEQDVVVREHTQKWDRERRRRAEYVAGVIGSSVIEADALIQRAASSGYDYDRVDWDSIQGKDLKYYERVAKLDETLHVETKTKGEIEQIHRQVDWVMDKYDEDQERYEEEIEHAMKDFYSEYLADEAHRRAHGTGC